MNLRSTLSEISEPECYDSVSPHWEQSVASLPVGTPFFLTPQAIRENRELTGIEPEIDEELFAHADRIIASGALRALVWHCYQWTYVYEAPGRMLGWPSFRPTLGDGGDVLYLLVTLAMAPLIKEAHQRLSVPQEITRQTMSGAASFLDRYRHGHNGRNGAFKCEMWWLRNYTSGELLRIGRFEYRIRPMRGQIRVYRNDRTRGTVALAAEGTRFDRFGYIEALDAKPDSEGWTAHLRKRSDGVLGTPISPFGRAEHRRARLDAAAWREVIVPDETPMLDVHIPSGGRMTPEAVEASLQDAAEYFGTRRDSKDFAGFYCVSWVFGPHLEEIFSASSNLVRLLKQVYLYPVPTNRADGLFFVFSDERYYGGKFDANWLAAHVPRTTLEAKVREFILAKKVWRGGGMFILREDLDRFGSETYRSAWPTA